MYRIKLVAGILTLALCLGCQTDIPDIGYVEGTVTLDGSPLPNAIVTFQPEHARPSYGRTDENGWYELVYTDGNEGAILGKHRVSISTKDSGNPDEGIEPSPEKVPAKYNTRTELTAEVTPGNNKCDFPLKSEGEIDQSDESEEEA